MLGQIRIQDEREKLIQGVLDMLQKLSAAQLRSVLIFTARKM